MVAGGLTVIGSVTGQVTVGGKAGALLIVERPAITDVSKTLTYTGDRTVLSINPKEVRFSQNTVSSSKVRDPNVPTYQDLVQSMRKDGWIKDPVDVVRMPDGKLTSMDNKRLRAANEAGVNIKANIHAFDEPLPLSIKEARGWMKYDTWGEAMQGRINKQSREFSKKKRVFKKLCQ